MSARLPPKVAVIVFARVPVPGRAKTRLAPALGPEGAAALAARMLQHAVGEAMACGADVVELRLAADGGEGTAPAGRPADQARAARAARAAHSTDPTPAMHPAPAAHPAIEALRQAYPALRVADQGEGDLGRRMSRALEAALRTHDAAVLLGTDAPALDAARIAEAAATLRTHDAVFVPALDGGYALVGLARPAPQLFEAIAWSTPQVMAQTRERAACAGLALAELAPVADIDEPADLVHVPTGWIEGT